MLRFGLIIAAAVFVADQISKWIILGPLAFSPPGCREFHVNCGEIELSSVFDLRMVWNPGVSFGLLRADTELGRWLLVALQAGIALVFLYWLIKGPVTRRGAIALGFVIGGALGNVVDRIRFGAVVDFFDFSGLWFPWVFNVADAAINIGAALLVLDFLLSGDRKSNVGEQAPAPQNGREGP